MNDTLQLRSPAGFSLLEILLAVSIVGILANIGIPIALDALADAEIAALLGDVDAIFKAADNYRIDAGRYPRSAGWRTVPTELTDLLDGVPFERGDIWYRWYDSSARHGVLLYARSDPRPLLGAQEQWNGLSTRFGNLVLLYEQN